MPAATISRRDHIADEQHGTTLPAALSASAAAPVQNGDVTSPAAETDEDMAARLQREEMQLAGATFSAALSNDQFRQSLVEAARRQELRVAAGGQGGGDNDRGGGEAGDNGEEMAGDTHKALSDSRGVLLFHLIKSSVEIVASCIVLYLSEGLPCDQPLKVWLWFYTLRYLFTLPVLYRRFARYYRWRRVKKLGRYVEGLAEGDADAQPPREEEGEEGRVDGPQQQQQQQQLPAEHGDGQGSGSGGGGGGLSVWSEPFEETAGAGGGDLGGTDEECKRGRQAGAPEVGAGVGVFVTRGDDVVLHVSATHGVAAERGGDGRASRGVSGAGVGDDMSNEGARLRDQGEVGGARGDEVSPSRATASELAIEIEAGMRPGGEEEEGGEEGGGVGGGGRAAWLASILHRGPRSRNASVSASASAATASTAAVVRRGRRASTSLSLSRPPSRSPSRSPSKSRPSRSRRVVTMAGGGCPAGAAAGLPLAAPGSRRSSRHSSTARLAAAAAAEGEASQDDQKEEGEEGEGEGAEEGAVRMLRVSRSQSKGGGAEAAGAGGGGGRRAARASGNKDDRTLFPSSPAFPRSPPQPAPPGFMPPALLELRRRREAREARELYGAALGAERRRAAEEFRGEKTIKKWLSFFTVVWLVVGHLYLVGDGICAETAKLLYYYCVVLVVVAYTTLASPFLLVVAVILVYLGICLWGRLLLKLRGPAVTREIRALPTRIFKRQQQQQQQQQPQPGKGKGGDKEAAEIVATGPGSIVALRGVDAGGSGKRDEGGDDGAGSHQGPAETALDRAWDAIGAEGNATATLGLDAEGTACLGSQEGGLALTSPTQADQAQGETVAGSGGQAVAAGEEAASVLLPLSPLLSLRGSSSPPCTAEGRGARPPTPPFAGGGSPPLAGQGREDAGGEGAAVGGVADAGGTGGEGVEEGKDDATWCVICYEDYEDGEVIRQLPCKHEFHAACVDPWLKSNGSCPLCRHAAVKHFQRRSD